MDLRKAPDFTLPDQNGKTHRLNDYAGRWVVVYFYPQDNSLNCTKEACNFRDEYRALEQFGNAAVIGINHGSVESHKRFAEQHHLNFPILSDTGHRITEAFGAWRTNPSRPLDKLYGTRRNTYIINPEGHIVREYLSPKVRDHVEQVISDLQELQAQALAAK